MTNGLTHLYALVETPPEVDLLREMIGFAAEKLMVLEVGAATGRGLERGVPAADRPAQRLPGTWL